MLARSYIKSCYVPCALNQVFCIVQKALYSVVVHGALSGFMRKAPSCEWRCAQVLRRLGFEGTSVAKTAKSQARVILFNYWCASDICPFRFDGGDVNSLQLLACTLHAHAMSCSPICQPWT